MDSSVSQESATFDKVLFGRSLSRILSPPKPSVVSPLETNSVKIPECVEGNSEINSSQEATSRPSKIGPSRFSTLMIAFKPWRWRRRRRKNHKTAESTKGTFEVDSFLSYPVNCSFPGCDTKVDGFFTGTDMEHQHNGSTNSNEINSDKSMFIHSCSLRIVNWSVSSLDRWNVCQWHRNDVRWR